MSVKILIGDSLTMLKTLPDESVHCVVTSPPYFGLRDYGIEGQMGSEATPAQFIEAMTGVFREVRRVLRSDGTCWVNMGDSYATAPGQATRGGPPSSSSTLEGNGHRGGGPKLQLLKRVGSSGNKGNLAGDHERRPFDPALKPKDLMGMPWRLAFALQQPYYTGRIKEERDRIWLAAMIDAEGCFFIHKRKAGTDAHSKFTKADGTESVYTRTADTFGPGLEICNTSMAIIARVQAIVGMGTVVSQSPEQNNRRKQTIYRWRVQPNEAKNLARELYPHLVAKQHQARLIYNCPSSGDAGAAAHGALIGLHRGVPTKVDYPAPPTMFEPGWYLRQDVIWSKSNPMPESVRDRCTKAHEYIFLLSKSERYFYDQDAIRIPIAESSVQRLSQDVAAQRGSERVPGKTNGAMKAVPSRGMRRTDAEGYGLTKGMAESNPSCVHENGANRRSVWVMNTQGFSEAHFATFPPELPETCIKAGCPKDGTVLDPFFGAGTTGLVADRLQRNCIGIELNPEYAEMARKRIYGDAPLFAEVE